MAKYYPTHAELLKRAKAVVMEIIAKRPSVHYRIYGVPRGGIPVAYMINGILESSTVVSDSTQATIIVDDIIDSGRTNQRYHETPETHGIPFFALYDKRKEPDLGWVVFPWEVNFHGEAETVEDNIARIIQHIGEDPNRDGLKETPARVVKSFGELYGGYSIDPESVFTTFESEGYDQMVILKDIEFFSSCEHHMLPFFGKAHIAYIPDGKVIGISKLARLLDIYSRRLQIQERIGEQVTAALMKHLQPKGAACIIEAKHLCMCARGVQKQHSVMTTSSIKGVFRDDGKAREELTGLIR